MKSGLDAMPLFLLDNLLKQKLVKIYWGRIIDFLRPSGKDYESLCRIFSPALLLLWYELKSSKNPFILKLNIEWQTSFKMNDKFY